MHDQRDCLTAVRTFVNERCSHICVYANSDFNIFINTLSIAASGSLLAEVSHDDAKIRQRHRRETPLLAGNHFLQFTLEKTRVDNHLTIF